MSANRVKPTSPSRGPRSENDRVFTQAGPKADNEAICSAGYFVADDPLLYEVVGSLRNGARERQMPKGYFFLEVEVIDPTDYDTYRSQSLATLQKYGGRFIVRGGEPVLVEGVDQPRRVVIAEFDSPESVQKWYNSPEYQAILPIRLRSCKVRALFLTGN